MNKIVTYLMVVLTMAITSCIEKPVYPSKPVIAYKDFLRYGNLANPDSVELMVSFTDNEGDIGLEQSDTDGIFKNGNIYMDYYFWDTTGIDHWSAYDPNPLPPFDTLKFGYRVPPVLQKGDESEPMKGLIYAKQTKNAGPITLHSKIMYVVYLYDKAMHRSDTIHTPAILF